MKLKKVINLKYRKRFIVRKYWYRRIKIENGSVRKKRQKIVPRPFPENQPKPPYFAMGLVDDRIIFNFLYNYFEH